MSQTASRTQRGIRRELSIQAVKRGHVLPPKWEQFGNISKAECQRCHSLIAGNGVYMRPGTLSCEQFASQMRALDRMERARG